MLLRVSVVRGMGLRRDERKTVAQLHKQTTCHWHVACSLERASGERPRNRAVCAMMYDAYQAMADLGDSRPPARRQRRTHPQCLVGRARSPRRCGGWRPITNWSRSPASPMNGPDFDLRLRRGARRSHAGRGRGRAVARPFCDLRRFRKEGGEDEPKVLLVAPMSGHFATLLRGTLRTMLQRPRGLCHGLGQSAQHPAGIRAFSRSTTTPSTSSTSSGIIGAGFAYRRRLPARRVARWPRPP